MLPNDYDQSQADQQQPEGPLDRVDDLYIGNFGEEAVATIKIETSEGESFVIQARGEVLFQAHIEGERFIVDRVRRVALYGARDETVPPDRLGVLSLGGPLTEPDFEQGWAGLQLRFHYRALSLELDPLYKEGEDAVFPEVARVRADLTWEQESTANERETKLIMALRNFEVEDDPIGLVQRIELEPTVTSFGLAGTGDSPPEAQYSLPTRCDLSPEATCALFMDTVMRWLPIKFVSFSRRPLDQVEAVCVNQIAEVCDIWGHKAALDLAVFRSFDTLWQGSDAFSSIHDVDIYNPFGGLLSAGFDWSFTVEIYLVDSLLDHQLGGGVTFDCGVASAFCVLALNNMDPTLPVPAGVPQPARGVQANPRLLAHELSHVLGLDHPGTFSPYPGSSNSIAAASVPLGSANVSRNTLYNCRVLTAQVNTSGQSVPLNDIVGTTKISDCFHTDP